MEPSSYVSDVAKPLDRVAARLNDLVKAGALPATARVGMWSCVINHVMERFVEAFSRVKKCSVPGRGLMTLDVGQVYSRAVKVGPLLPGSVLHDKPYVDGYISAFYLDHEADLLQWMLKNRHMYPLHQMRAIVRNGIGAALKKKQLADVMMAIDAMYLAPAGGPGAAGAGGAAGPAGAQAASASASAAAGGAGSSV
jgi:hypothetical protein